MMRMNPLRAAVLALCCVAAQGANAQLFGDDQARQAILDLRQRFDQSVAAQNRLVDENAQMRRSMMDLQQQIESLRGDLARSRGQEEQLTRDIADLKKAQADTQRATDERLRKVETAPSATTDPNAGAGSGALTGEGSANEKQDYDAALAVFDGHFPQAAILPGEAQLDWAVQLAREAFLIPSRFLRMEALKFQRVARPGDTIHLELEWQAERCTLQFRYTSVHGPHASGRVVFDHGE